MPSIDLRDVPDDVYGALQQKAAAEQLTVEQEAIRVLAEALKVPPVDNRERRRRLFESIDRLNLPATSQWPDPVDLIREDRDR